MKNKTKQHIKDLGISSQIRNRHNKTAKGMSYTNERRARRTGNSIFFAAFVDKRKYHTSDEARTLSVKGTLDVLNRRNSVKKYKMKKYLEAKRKQGNGQTRRSNDRNDRRHEFLDAYLRL